MGKIVHNEPFQASRNGMRQITVDAGTGSATLYALAGSKTGTPILVDNGALSADGIITFYAVSDQWFRVTIAGNAEAWITG